MLGAASFGDWLGLLATAIFASAQFEQSAAKGAAFGGSIAIRLVPALVFGPIVGVLADRFDRRYTMVICDLIRFVFYGSIPIVALLTESAAVTVAWLTIATFVGETVTLMWIPAKEAAVPNLIPKARLEVSNQLTLITTYGITPVLAAVFLAALDGAIRNGLAGGLPNWAEPAQLALYFNALSRLATALVVFFGIKEISEGARSRREANAQRGMLSQFLEGWKYVGSTPLVRGLVLGIFGAFAGAGIVIGTAKFFIASLGAGDAAFSLLFGTLFIGLAVGIGLGPMVVRELSRRRWFGMSIVLASGSVMFLAVAIHLSMALLGALMVGAGAGMAFLAGTTLLGREVGDEVRGRVFAVVQVGTRLVLLLAISLSGVLVGAGGSRRIEWGNVGVDVSSTRVLLLVAGIVGVWTGIGAFRQMDDKHGVPVLADLWGSVRGRPLSPAEPFTRHGIFVVFEGGEGAGKSTQVKRLAEAVRADGRDVVVTREPGATDMGVQIRGLVLERGAGTDPPSPRAEALLYAADRAHHVATVVRPALARGAVVISDRYVDSSLAYQGAGRTLPVQEISWLSSWATGGLKPDLVVLLDVDPGVGLGRVGSRGQGRDRLESESRAFHERVRYAFLDLAAADPKRYLVLDAARPADEIGSAVIGRIHSLLAAGDDNHPPATSTAVPTEPPSTEPDPGCADLDRLQRDGFDGSSYDEFGLTVPARDGAGRDGFGPDRLAQGRPDVAGTDSAGRHSTRPDLPALDIAALDLTASDLAPPDHVPQGRALFGRPAPERPALERAPLDRPAADGSPTNRPVPDRPVPDRPVRDRPVADRPGPDRPAPSVTAPETPIEWVEDVAGVHDGDHVRPGEVHPPVDGAGLPPTDEREFGRRR